MTLGETIRELRREKSLSQEQLAERTGLSRQTIYKWESGQAAPDLENLKTLAGALGTTVSRLLGEAPPPSRPDPQDPLDKGARMVKKHWRKGGYVLMAYGAGAVAFGLVGRAMLGGFFRASAQVPAGFSPLAEGGSPFGAMQSAMLLVPTAALLAGVAMVAVGGYLAWKDWKLNHKK
ncbi:hypothetical protein CE91St44_02840 [Oscillospiraceae bacterium]|nr:hypothetical protein CE91St44_02840 [Oscillospiraceae bacterium]